MAQEPSVKSTPSKLPPDTRPEEIVFNEKGGRVKPFKMGDLPEPKPPFGQKKPAQQK